MTEREIERNRLIELLIQAHVTFGTGKIADYLLENGVIVPPCKVGDTVYFVHRGRIKQLEIHNITYSSKYKDFYLYFVSDDGRESNINYNHFIGYKLFLTKEEAEKAL